MEAGAAAAPQATTARRTKTQKITPDQTGTNGNISADPKYVDPARGNYRLGYLSPAIDAANGTVAPPTDQAGDPRYNDPRTKTRTGVPALARRLGSVKMLRRAFTRSTPRAAVRRSGSRWWTALS